MKFPRLICTLVSGFLLLGVFACKTKNVSNAILHETVDKTSVSLQNKIVAITKRIDVELEAPAPSFSVKHWPPLDKDGNLLASWETFRREGDKEEAREYKRWIKSGKDVTQPKLKEAFLEACRWKNQYAVKVLLDAGIDVPKEEWEQIIINKVLYTDNPSEESDENMSEVMLLLLNAGAKANGHALKVASNLSFAKVVKTLLDSGVDDKQSISDSLLYVDEYAVGNAEVTVKMLLDAGANPNVTDEDGTTALQSAVWLGRTEVVKILLSAGADVNMKDEQGNTALTLAQKAGNEEIVKLLKAAGAKK